MKSLNPTEQNPDADNQSDVIHLNETNIDKQRDMSRRKQKNPKPCFTSKDDHDDVESVDSSKALSEDEDFSTFVKSDIEEEISSSVLRRLSFPSATTDTHQTPQPNLFCHTTDIPNMFHLGDVTVDGHPDTPTGPIVIPTAYLYPIQNDGSQQVCYRMFVPFSSPPIETIPNSTRQIRRFENFPGTPLDLSRSSELSPQDSIYQPAFWSPSDHQRIAQNIQQKEIEIQLQLRILKSRQLEFLQSFQQNHVASPTTPMMSRCEDCNINFANYLNFLAHKKHYCSSSTRTNPDVASDEEDDDQSNGTKTPSSISSEIEPTLGSPVFPTPRIKSNLFECDGCGIKFKSLCNLKAHQNCYCAGHRKQDELRGLKRTWEPLTPGRLKLTQKIFRNIEA